MVLFRGIDFENLKDGEYIQFFGVHMLSWRDIERATGIKPTIAFIEDDTLEKQNADLLEKIEKLQDIIDDLDSKNTTLVVALEKITNPLISPPIDKNDWMADIAEQALAQVKEK